MEIKIEDYFGTYSGKEDEIHRVNAKRLLTKVNFLLARAAKDGVTLDINPKTKTLISGTKNGGWRPKDCPDGAPNSSHKVGKGVDVYDPDGDLDNWIMTNRQVLVDLDLAIEHPSATRGWCHITDRLPKSGNRIFYP